MNREIIDVVPSTEGHESGSTCWCKPYLGNKAELELGIDDKELWIHNEQVRQ